MRLQDITGKRFDRLLVLRRGAKRTNATMWLCQCDCGNTKEVRAGDLQRGFVRSCGCLFREASSERSRARAEDVTGRSFGTFDVIGLSDRYRVRKTGKRSRLWRCRCQCGAEFYALVADMRNGQVTGCGCVRLARSKKASRARAEEVDLFGEKLSLREVAEVGAINYITLYDRVTYQGMALEDAAFNELKQPPTRSAKVPF